MRKLLTILLLGMLVIAISPARASSPQKADLTCAPMFVPGENLVCGTPSMLRQFPNWESMKGLSTSPRINETNQSLPVCPLPNWDTKCEAWAATYDNPSGHANPYGYTGIDRVWGTAVNPDGSLVYVTGASYDQTTGYDAATVAFDTATGEQVWLARFDGAGTEMVGDAAAAITVSSDGSAVFITGGTSLGVTEAGTAGTILTVAYDAQTGEQLWQQSTDLSPWDDYGMGIAASDDKVFVIGAIGVPTIIEGDIVTVAFDAATGAEDWRVPHDHGFGDLALGIAVSSDGSKVFSVASAFYIPVAERPNSFALQYLALSHDAASGAELWVSTFRGTSEPSYVAQALGFAAAPDGSALYITGGADDPSTPNVVEITMTTVAIGGSNGGLLWTASRNSGSAGLGVAVSPDLSTVYATGGNNNNYVTAAYSASTGAQRWAAGYGGPQANWEWATSVTVSPNGQRVYVTGLSAQAVGTFIRGDYATVAHNASTGGSIWVARWNTSFTETDLDFDPNVRLVGSPDGKRLFVAGTAIHQWGNPLNYYDYGIAAYDV